MEKPAGEKEGRRKEGRREGRKRKRKRGLRRGRTVDSHRHTGRAALAYNGGHYYTTRLRPLEHYGYCYCCYCYCCYCSCCSRQLSGLYFMA